MAKFNWSGEFIAFDAFRRYLASLPRYAWIKGLTLHHTGNPPLAQWNGAKSMQGTAEYYQFTKKWTAGPHLFVASGAPRSNGVWLGTPLSMPGIHAGKCNSSMIGLEVVGNYDLHPWNSDQENDIYTVLDDIFDWLGLAVSPQTLKGHRDCLPNKTCPGAAISMPVIRGDLTQRRSHVPVYTEWLVKWPGTRVRQTPTASGKILKVLNPSSTPIKIARTDIKGALVYSNGMNSDRWAEVLGGGYIWQYLLQQNDTIL